MATVDYYDLIETAVVEFIQDNVPAGYITNADKQITKSDDTYLDQGFDYFAFAYPGAFPSDLPWSVTTISVDWEVIIDVLVRFKTTEPAAWTAFRAWRAELFHIFNLSRQGRTLGQTNGVEKTLFAAEDRPRYIPVEPGNPDSGVLAIGQACILTVTQKINKVT